MTGKDCNGNPIHIGDEVEWIYDSATPKIRRRVVGLGDRYEEHQHEGGYFQVQDMSDLRGYSQRFGHNLRVLMDLDLAMDEGL